MIKNTHNTLNGFSLFRKFPSQEFHFLRIEARIQNPVSLTFNQVAWSQMYLYKIWNWISAIWKTTNLGCAWKFCSIPTPHVGDDRGAWVSTVVALGWGARHLTVFDSSKPHKTTTENGGFLIRLDLGQGFCIIFLVFQASQYFCELPNCHFSELQ
jgi:hypothetical protein